jgi:hypothetical protein
MNPTVELVLKHKKAKMRKSEFRMLEALKSAPHLNDSPGYQLVISSILANKCDGSSVIWIQMPIHFILSVANTVRD